MNVDLSDDDTLFVVAAALWTVAMVLHAGAVVRDHPPAVWPSALYLEAIFYAMVVVLVLDRVTDLFGERWPGVSTGAWLYVALFALLGLIGAIRLAMGAGTVDDSIAAAVGAVGVLVMVSFGWWKRDELRVSI